VSEALLADVLSSDIGPSYRSDYSIVKLSVKKEDIKRDRQFWKFNYSLLRDKYYVEEIKTVVENVKKEYALPVYNMDNINSILNDDLQLQISDQLFFEMLLLKIREKSISYSSYKKKQ
jgi:hypothetical protein